MKKIIFLASVLIAFPVFAQNTTEICTQVLQSAVSPKGECEVYPTPCDVPEDWKKVSSCENVKSPSFGKTPEEVLKRRRGNIYWRKFRAKNPSKKHFRSPQNNRLASGSWTRPRRTEGKREISRLKKRTVNFRVGPSNIYMKDNPYKLKKASQKERQRRRKVSINARTGSATQIKRSGPLSFKPKWKIEKRSHFKRNLDFGKGRPWRSIQMTRRKPKKDLHRTYKPKLRQIYKGKLLKGVLGS